MGAGYHGGFGNTHGSGKVIVADPSLVGNGHGFELKEAATRVKPKPGYTDVAVHGTPDKVYVFTNENGKEKAIALDHRRLAKFIKSDKNYKHGKIRLLSCKTGSDMGSFAQNLANKLGVTVLAPSDTLYIYPNGRMVIGPNMYTDSGRWIPYHPQRKKR